MNWTAVIAALASSAASLGITFYLYRRKLETIASKVESLKDFSHIRILREAKLMAADLRKIF